MPAESEPIFTRLRTILEKHRADLSVTHDQPDRFCIEGRTGPATLQAWGGKLKKPTIPVAWVEIGKSYVSYHIMGIYGNTTLSVGMSKELKSRMQGKTCFNFTSNDEAIFEELDQLTERGIAAFRKAGFIS